MVDFLAISNSLKVSVYVLGPYKPDFLFIFIEPPQKKKKNLNNLFKTSKRDYNDSKNQNPIEIIKKIFLGLNILFTHVQMKTLHSLNSSLQDEFIDIKIRFLFLLESGLPTMFPLFFYFLMTLSTLTF